MAIIFKAIETLTKEDILPGITRLIGELKEHGVKLSIASSFQECALRS